MGNFKISGNVNIGTSNAYLLKNVANRPSGVVNFPTFTLNDSTTTREATITLTTTGKPVFIICTGDLNPGTGTDWADVRLYRDSTFLRKVTVQGTAQSQNGPFCVSYFDNIAAGTYVYKVSFVLGRGTCQFGEEGNQQAPIFSAWEI